MRRSRGFTLLEVMVAMTLTALALGSLYSVIAGNKRLAGRAEAALLHGIEVRSLINSSQLNDAQGEVFTETRRDKLKLETDEKLETPARKTKATAFELRKFHVKDEHGADIVSGSYWMKPVLPETPPEVALEPEPAQTQGTQQGAGALGGNFGTGQGGPPGGFRQGRGGGQGGAQGQGGGQGPGRFGRGGGQGGQGGQGARGGQGGVPPGNFPPGAFPPGTLPPGGFPR